MQFVYTNDRANDLTENITKFIQRTLCGFACHKALSVYMTITAANWAMAFDGVEFTYYKRRDCTTQVLYNI